MILVEILKINLKRCKGILELKLEKSSRYNGVIRELSEKLPDIGISDEIFNNLFLSFKNLLNSCKPYERRIFVSIIRFTFPEILTKSFLTVTSILFSFAMVSARICAIFSTVLSIGIIKIVSLGKLIAKSPC